MSNLAPNSSGRPPVQKFASPDSPLFDAHRAQSSDDPAEFSVALAPRHQYEAALDKCTGRQRLFVEAYLTCFNGTEAVIKCKDVIKCKTPRSQRQTAVRFMSNVVVKAAVEAGIRARAYKYQVRQDEVLRELGNLGLSNMADYVDIDAAGQPTVNLGRATRQQMSAVQEIRTRTRTTTVIDGVGEDAVEKQIDVTDISFKLHPKEPALKLLGQHVGLFDRQGNQLNVALGVQVNIVDVREKLLAKLAG